MGSYKEMLLGYCASITLINLKFNYQYSIPMFYDHKVNFQLSKKQYKLALKITNIDNGRKFTEFKQFKYWLFMFFNDMEIITTRLNLIKVLIRLLCNLSFVYLPWMIWVMFCVSCVIYWFEKQKVGFCIVTNFEKLDYSLEQFIDLSLFKI